MIALVAAQWRYSDARVGEIEFVEVGHPDDPLGPGVNPNRTFDVEPHAEATDYDDSAWRKLTPEETQLRLSQGRVCFNWYRVGVTIPERVGDLDPTGASVVFEVVIDDYAEVWVNGELPHALGDTGGHVAGGFNAPNRVLLTDDARPGQQFQIAVFGINGPISASPHNYIWMRTATLDFYASERARPVAGRRTRGRASRFGAGLDRRVRRDARAGCGRVCVHRGAGVESGWVAAVQLPEHERDLPLASGRARVGVSLQERLQRHRHRPFHPTRVKRPHVRRTRTADDLSARQPARAASRAARQRDRAG